MNAIVQTMPPPGRAQRRVGWLFVAILLQAGFVFALVAGLNVKGIQQRFVDPFVVSIPKAKQLPPQRPISGEFVDPKKVEIVEPKFVFDDGKGGGDAIDPRNTGVRPTLATDHGPVGVMATHTTPPYPPIEARLGHQGTVMLRLTINPQGVVTDATVVRSSGYEVLDDVARAWVMAHWRYQGAIRGGVAAPGAVTVGVKFDLRNAG